MLMKRRDVVLSVIFCFITFGIYAIYWYYHLNNDVNYISKHPEATGGGMVILLTIITFGIYGWYWMYKAGAKLDETAFMHNRPQKGYGILYLILDVIGLGFISYLLIQLELNYYIDLYNTPDAPEMPPLS